MLIDWFTVGAQIVNFLVLVVVLKLVLFDRVVAAMDEREEGIASRLRSAEERESEARVEAAAFRDRSRRLDDETADRMRRAEAEAAARRRELVDEARAGVEELRTAWQEALRRDRAQLLDEVRRRAGERACAISRRALADLADAELEDQLVRVAARRIETSAAELRPILAAAPTGGGPVTVRTAFPLTAEQIELVERAVAAGFGRGRDELEIVDDPELICGLEVEIGGWSAGWSIDGYLDAVAEELEGLLPIAKPERVGER